MKTKIVPWLFAITLLLPWVAWAEGDNDTEGLALTATADGCRAIFSVSDQTLTLPCVAVVMGNETALYSAQLQQVGEGSFALTQATELSVAVESDCVASYSLETGELGVPCVEEVNPPEVAETRALVLYAEEPGAPSVFVMDRLGATARARLAPPTLITPSNSSKNISLSPTFNWNSSLGTTYSIVVSTRSDFAGFTDANSVSSCKDTCFTAKTSSKSYNGFQLAPNTAYYWKVRASSDQPGYETSNWSPVWSFSTVATNKKPRYPVLLIHGLCSDATTWNDFQQWWSSSNQWVYGGRILVMDKYHLSEPGDGANSNARSRSTPTSFLYDVTSSSGDVRKGDVYTMNFSSNQDISFAAQGLQVREAVNFITDQTGKGGVYVVSHSMGGLATRAYLQYFNDGKVKGLITIGTPHFGRRNDLTGDVGSIGATAFGCPGGGAVPDVISQLVPNNSDLNMLNNLTQYPLPKIANYFAIVVRGRTYGGTPYTDAEGDGVVPIASQSGPSGWKDPQEVSIQAEYTRLQVHTLETQDNVIRNVVYNKIREWSK